MRTEKVDGATTKYFYDGQMPIEEDYNPSGTVTKVTRNTLGGRGIDMILTTTSSGTEDRYPLYDGHGNMIATLGRNGSGGYAIGDSRTYDVLGSVRSGAASGGPSKRHSANLGHQADDESDLLYMRARYYEPGSGRFVSEDSRLDGQNYYTYAFNNPITNIDANGNEAESDSINDELLWFSISVVLLWVGGQLLGYSMEQGVEHRIQKYYLGQAEKAVKALRGGNAELYKRAMSMTTRLKGNVGRSRLNQGLSVVLGYLMIVAGLLIDIDLAASVSGYDPVLFVWGRD